VREQDSGGYEETSGNMIHRTDPRKYTNCLLIYNTVRSYVIMI
jgi:hypothetical protein